MPKDWNRFVATWGVVPDKKRSELYLEYINDIMATLALAETAMNGSSVAPLDTIGPALKELRAKVTAIQDTLRKQQDSVTLKDALPKLAAYSDEADVLLGAIRRLILDPGVTLDVANNAAARSMLDTLFDENAKLLPSDEEKARMKTLMVKRFGLDPDSGLEGDWSSKSLRALNGLLKKLPVSEVTGNDRLKHFKMDEKPKGIKHPPQGVHKPTEDRVILYGLDPDSVFKTKLDQDGVDEPAIGVLSRTRNTFSHVTLHEVGHAVDTRIGFSINALGGGTNPAGWQTERINDVVAAVMGLADKDGTLAQAFDALPVSFLEEVVTALLESQDGRDAVIALKAAALTKRRASASSPPTVDNLSKMRKEFALAHELGHMELSELSAAIKRTESKSLETLLKDGMRTCGVKDPWRHDFAQIARDLLRAFELSDVEDFQTLWQEVITGDPLRDLPLHPEYADSVDPDWAAFKAHAAIVTAAHIGKDKDTFWMQGNDGALAATIGGRVYFHSANGGWYSYLPAARRHKVSDYQFNAPMEWFAELYAVYKQDILPDQHPHYRVIEQALG